MNTPKSGTKTDPIRNRNDSYRSIVSHAAKAVPSTPITPTSTRWGAFGHTFCRDTAPE